MTCFLIEDCNVPANRNYIGVSRYILDTPDEKGSRLAPALTRKSNVHTCSHDVRKCIQGPWITASMLFWRTPPPNREVRLAKPNLPASEIRSYSGMSLTASEGLAAVQHGSPKSLQQAACHRSAVVLSHQCALESVLHVRFLHWGCRVFQRNLEIAMMRSFCVVWSVGLLSG